MMMTNQSESQQLPHLHCQAQGLTKTQWDHLRKQSLYALRWDEKTRLPHRDRHPSSGAQPAHVSVVAFVPPPLLLHLLLLHLLLLHLLLLHLLLLHLLLLHLLLHLMLLHLLHLLLLVEMSRLFLLRNGAALYCCVLRLLL